MRAVIGRYRGVSYVAWSRRPRHAAPPGGEAFRRSVARHERPETGRRPSPAWVHVTSAELRGAVQDVEEIMMPKYERARHQSLIGTSSAFNARTEPERGWSVPWMRRTRRSSPAPR